MREQHLWTQEEEDWLLANYKEFANHNCGTTKFNEVFNTTLSYAQVNNKYISLTKNYRSTRYTLEMDAWLATNYGNGTYLQLSQEFNRVFKTNKSRDCIQSRCNKLFGNKHKLRIGKVTCSYTASRNKYDYYIKLGTNKRKHIPQEIYENNKLVDNCALAYGIIRETEEVKE